MSRVPQLDAAEHRFELRGVIHARGVTYRYARAETAALNGLSLHVRDGSLFGLLGPNGSGKTTFISILAGLLPVPRGTVSMDGRELRENRSVIQATTALVPQDYAFYPSLTVRENLQFFAAVQHLPRRELASRVQEASTIAGLEQSGGRRAATLSGGMKRRLNLAIGLLNRPRLLLLDEPTVGIDPQSRAFILEAITRINRQGTTIVYTTHYMEEVEAICDTIGILDRGRLLACGSLAELLAGSRNRRLLVELESPLSAALREALSFIAGVVADPRALTIDDCAVAEVYRVMALLHQHGIGITRLQYGHGKLEEQFLMLTNRALRDS